MDFIETLLLYAGAVVAVASVIVKALAAITGVTPNTRDDEVIGKAQRAVKTAQKVLGTISMNAEKK